MNRLVRNLLGEPTLRDLPIDGPSSTLEHREILLRKPLLRAVFYDFYRQCLELDRRFFGDAPGRRVELGAGSSLLSRVYPEVISSDVKFLPFVDLIASGTALPFRSESLRAIYAINVFHHLPDVDRFFTEALRALHPSGGVVLIEPFHGPLARWLFKRMHRSETFDTQMPQWSYGETAGPMSKANQALSYVVFVRDRHLYEQRFPDLELMYRKCHTQARYLLSGGVNFRSLLPTRLTRVAHLLEKLLTPANPLLALQQTLVLRKKNE